MDIHAGPEMQDDGQWVSETGFSYFSTACGAPAAPITTVHFDTVEELLWTGNDMGRVVSFHSAAATRYTAFVLPGAVRAIDSIDGCVLTLAHNCLRAYTRQGCQLFHYQNEKTSALTTLHRIVEAPNTVYIGGEQQEIVHLDYETQRELRVIRIKEKDATIIRSNAKFLLTSDSDGQMAVRDMNSLELLRAIPAHGGPIVDFDVCGNQLITCGASFRAGALHGDPYLKIYDLRTFRTLPPIPLSFAPAFSRFMPSYTDSKVIVLSHMGQMQLLDLNSRSGLPLLVETEGVPLCSFAFSPSRQLFAFGDAAGRTHMYSDRAEPTFLEDAEATEFADIPVGPPHSFAIEDSTQSLASIAFPFSTEEHLLSDWPEDLCEYISRKLKPLPVHSTVRNVQFVGYAQNPRKGTDLARFNVCPYQLEDKEDGELKEEKEQEQDVMVPRFYKPVVFKQTLKSGDEVTALQRYNRTARVPIEYNHGANFANPLAQILWHVPALRNFFLNHLCKEEHCILCQIGFLCRMLSDKPPSQPASSNNLMRALRGSSFAGLAPSIAAADRLQQLANFIFDYAVQNLQPTELEKLSSLVNYSLTSNIRCVRCVHVLSEPREQPLFKLCYPAGDAPVTFCSLLEKSLHGRKSTQAHCDECGTVTRVEETLRVRALPPVLLLDANPTGAHYTHFWKTQLSLCERRPRYGNPPQEESERSERPCRWGDDCRNRPSCKYTHGSGDWETECAAWMEEGRGSWQHYVPARFFARLSGGIAALQTNEPDTTDCTEISTFELVAVAVVISEDPHHASWKYIVAECLESHLNEEENKGPRDSTDEPDSPPLTWLIINGIAVSKVSQDEALHMDARWKMPLLFVYVKKSSNAMTVKETRMEIPSDIFFTDANLTKKGSEETKDRELMIPGKGDIVGIDAEFISMSKDGSRKSVGRVSCVDETGESILMDDYIRSCDGDIVHDYLTQYSGIMEVDLCPDRSSKHLTTLKAVYVKLLHLIERGVVFVGHALFNDFSMLNIYVPSEQMRDTVQLFRLPQQRLISLQFLAWHLLDTRIQENVHDSIEDARISLALFKKWQELDAQGALDATIRSLYERGKCSNWRVGASPGVTKELSSTPPLSTSSEKSSE